MESPSFGLVAARRVHKFSFLGNRFRTNTILKLQCLFSRNGSQVLIVNQSRSTVKTRDGPNTMLLVWEMLCYSEMWEFFCIIAAHGHFQGCVICRTLGSCYNVVKLYISTKCVYLFLYVHAWVLLHHCIFTIVLERNQSAKVVMMLIRSPFTEVVPVFDKNIYNLLVSVHMSGIAGSKQKYSLILV